MKKLIIAFIILVTTITTSTSQNTSEKYSRVKIHLEGRSIIELASVGIALQPFDFKTGEFFIGEFAEFEIQIIKGLNFKIDILIEDMSAYYQERNKDLDKNVVLQEKRLEFKNSKYPVPTNFTLGSMGGYHTYSEMIDDLDQMKELFPDLISSKTAISETLTIQNRPVYWVRISTNPEVETDKPKVLYTALTHAREPVSMQQMLYHMWYLLENYGTDPEVTYLIDNLEMYFVPCVNPDGYIYCETTHPNGGSMHRKNMRVNSDSSIGVDLNRNFGYMWGYDNLGSSPTPSALTYRGTGPFSEPETQNVKILAETFNFSLALNNHTYSDLLIYPWGYENMLTPDSTAFIKFAQLLTRENNYKYGTCYEVLVYYANGGSDDWFYGEQATKNKVFAFTPEAGSPADGFWPAINKIVDICAGHVFMNNALAHLALSYAELADVSPKYIMENTATVSFELTNLGLNNPANYTVTAVATSDNILSISNPVNITDMDLLDSEIIEFTITLSPSVTDGDKIEFIILTSNGAYEWETPITKYFGEPQVVFFDPSDNMDYWTSMKWGVSSSVYYSAPGSIGDSPNGNYTGNQNTSITTSAPIDLTNYIVATLSFMTKFNVEKDWDYVQLLVSDDNWANWYPLSGKFTQTGNEVQAPGQPIYHGLQNDWVLEEIDITEFTGSEIWLKFVFVSDGYVNLEGFYFDDIMIMALEKKEEDDDDNNISEFNSNTSIVYYNSNSEQIIIKFPEQRVVGNINVMITESSGKVINNNNFSNVFELAIPFSKQKPGTYIVSISGDYSISKKIIVIN